MATEHENPYNLKSDFKFLDIIRRKDHTDRDIYMVVNAGPSLAGLLLNPAHGVYENPLDEYTIHHFYFEEPSDFEKIDNVAKEFAPILNKFKGEINEPFQRKSQG